MPGTNRDRPRHNPAIFCLPAQKLFTMLFGLKLGRPGCLRQLSREGCQKNVNVSCVYFFVLMPKIGRGEKTPTPKIPALLRKRTVLLRANFVLTKDPKRPYYRHFVVKYTGRGLVVKRQGGLSKVQMLNLVLGVGVFSLLPIKDNRRCFHKRVSQECFIEVYSKTGQEPQSDKTPKCLKGWVLLGILLSLWHGRPSSHLAQGRKARELSTHSCLTTWLSQIARIKSTYFLGFEDNSRQDRGT